MGAGGSVVIQGANDRATNAGAYVINHRLLVDAILSAGGGTQNVNIVSPIPLQVEVVQMLSPFTGGTGDGRPIPISSTGSPGNVVHTVPINTKQRIFMSAANVSTQGIRITVRFGGNAATSDNRDYFLQPNDSRTIINGDIIQADGSTRIIYSSAPIANVVNLTGWVETI